MGIFISMYIAMPVVVLFSLLFPKDKRNGFICIGCFLIIWLIQALRDVSIGIDLESYIPFFENSPSRGVFDYYNNNFEKGYQLFNSLIALYLTDNPNVFLAIVSACTLIPVSVIFYRYSRNVFISFTVYSALILYHFSFSGLRQALAIGIIAISYYFIVDRKPLWFTISVILAMFFHSSAVFFIVAYPLCNWIKMSNKQYLFIAIIAIVCLFFLRPLAESLMLVFFPEGRYAGYLSHEVTMSYNFMILLLVVFLMTFLARGINIERYRILLFVAVLCQGLGLISTSASRLAYYFILFVPLALPEIGAAMTRIPQRIFNVSVFIFMVVFFFYCNSGGYLQVIPYKFFWE